VIATLSLLQPYGAVRFMLRHENYGGKCTTLALILRTQHLYLKLGNLYKITRFANNC
jgi:hypothetical protein